MLNENTTFPFMEVYMKTYQIVNRIYVKKKSKIEFWGKILNVFIILFLLFVLFQLSMGESIKDVFGPSIPLLAAACYAKTRCHAASGYESAALEITFGPEELQMVYPAINRNDGGGVRKESIQVDKTGLEKIMYSDELKSIRILAKAIVDVEYEKDHKKSTIDERLHNQSSEYIIYLPYNQANEIVEEIENSFGLTVERVG